MEQNSEIRPVKLEVNLDNLTNNIREIKRHVGDKTLIMAIVKANAYGHGASTCARIFIENGANKLGVSILSEGITLRKSGITAPILLLNYTPVEQYKTLIENDLTQTIFKYEDAKKLSDIACNLKKVVKIHIKIETGMNRIGFLPNKDSIDEILNIVKLPNIDVEGIYTHFATADENDKEFSKKQFEKFMWVINRLEELNIDIPIKHVSNSAAIIDLPEYRLDMVRPGIILYGYYPSSFVRKDLLDIKPAMELKSRISNIKTIKKGEGIGYGQKFITDRESKIATLPIGYADGYPRLLSNKANVSIRGTNAPIIGSICMDQLMIDITDIDNICIDDEAVLFGYKEKSYPKVEDLAKEIGTINYELLCMISMRVPRVYVKNNRIVHVEEYGVE